MMILIKKLHGFISKSNEKQRLKSIFEKYNY